MTRKKIETKKVHSEDSIPKSGPCEYNTVPITKTVWLP